MPGFSPQALNYKVENANMSLILIGDQPLAFAQTVSHTFGYGTEMLYGVGTAKPQENQQLRIAPTITLDNFALSAVGNSLLQGGQSFASILSNNQFTISVIDGISGTVRFSYIGCVAESFSESIPANRPITQAVTFAALDVVDQTGQSILNGQNAYSVPLGTFGVGANNLGINVNGGLNVNVGF